MMNLKIGDKELKIKFGYKPTLKERLISKIVKVSRILGSEEEKIDFEKLEDLLLYLPEIMLVGLQVYHPEYRYNYDTGEGKQEQLEKMFDLIDDYTKQEDADLMQLFARFNEELEKDSFLRSMLQTEKKKPQEETDIAETTETTETEN